jgi:type I restriction enzyme M protein
VNISKEEAVLSEDIFGRLKGMPLVDAYEAYQILDNDWNKISVDLEIIQSEGFEATKQVDPNMVIKKKNSKNQEVQDGWIGHVIPFELAQARYMSEAVESLKKAEERLSEIVASYDEALDELPEEEKDKDFVNDDKTAFVWAKVKKAIKAKDVEPEVLAVLKKVLSNNDEEKKLKKQIKDDGKKLHLETKKLIENLEDDQVMELLHDKWIVPLVESLQQLPDSFISELITKLGKLCSKYEDTLEQIEDQINSTENELSRMLSMLSGNDFDMQGIAELKKMLGGV